MNLDELKALGTQAGVTLTTISTLYDIENSVTVGGLEGQLNRLCDEAVKAVQAGTATINHHLLPIIHHPYHPESSYLHTHPIFSHFILSTHPRNRPPILLDQPPSPCTSRCYHHQSIRHASHCPWTICHHGLPRQNIHPSLVGSGCCASSLDRSRGMWPSNNLTNNL